jgi:hypothetical protein
MVYLMAFGGIAICAILVPEIVREDQSRHPQTLLQLLPWVAWVYAVAALFFAALFQVMQLLRHIDHNQAFSPAAVKALRNIKYLAIGAAVLIAAGAAVGISLAHSVDSTEDVTPFVTLGTAFTFAATVVAALAGTVQRVLQDAIAIKNENDLTV